MKKHLPFILRIISVFFLLLGSLSSSFLVSSVSAIDETNTPATVVIGQKLLDDCGKFLSSPTSVFVYEDKVFVTDSRNFKVLIYYLPFSDFQMPDVVIGSSDFCGEGAAGYAGNGVYATSEKTLNYPYSVFYDGEKLFIADYLNHRVLIYNSIPTENYASADVVIGQPDFSSSTANNGGVSATSLYRPMDIYSDGTKLFISDYSNNRILIYNNIPTENHASADVVIGQPNFSTNTANYFGVAATSLNQPFGLFVNSNKIFVSDRSNNRVLIYNTIPENMDDAPYAADIVLGQDDFISNSANKGGSVSASSINGPRGIHIIDSKLLISDTGNHRVLIFNSIPENMEGPPYEADIVLGQTDFTSNISGLSKKDFNSPYDVWSDGTNMFVADSSNNRVLYYDSFPTSSYIIASNVIGQPDFTSKIGAYSSTASSSSFGYSGFDVKFAGDKILIADSSNNRILIFNSIPTEDNASADVVIGQPDMTSNILNNGGVGGKPTDKTLYLPKSIYIYQDKLFVCDYYNNRVLVYNSIPTGDYAQADVIIGQPDFVSNTANNGGRSNKSLYWPSSVFYDGQKLYIAERGNNRILIFNSLPTENFAEADVVVGQPDFITGSSGTSSTKLDCNNIACFITVSEDKLIVSDSNNNRLLIFNSIPEDMSGAPYAADIVLGQPDFTTKLQYYGGVTGGTFGQPANLLSNGSRLFVSDCNTDRVLIFNTIPTVDNTIADVVIGKRSLTDNSRVSPYGKTTLGYGGMDISLEHNLFAAIGSGYSSVFLFPIGPQGLSFSSSTTYTNSLSGNIFTLASDDAKEMKVSTDSNFTGVDWESYSSTKEVLYLPEKE